MPTTEGTKPAGKSGRRKGKGEPRKKAVVQEGSPVNPAPAELQSPDQNQPLQPEPVHAESPKVDQPVVEQPVDAVAASPELQPAATPSPPEPAPTAPPVAEAPSRHSELLVDERATRWIEPLPEQPPRLWTAPRADSAAYLAMIRENLNPEVGIEGILATMYDSRTLHSREALEILEENFGDLVFKTRIRKTIRYAEAPVKGTSVLKYEPTGSAAEAYRELAKEVLNGAKARKHA